jgi:hypothetical protein
VVVDYELVLEFSAGERVLGLFVAYGVDGLLSTGSWVGKKGGRLGNDVAGSRCKRQG